jgi:hypothetical protein
MTKITCERCKNDFIKEESLIGDILGLNKGGFKTIENTLLCKSCYRHFLIVFDKFMEKNYDTM